MLMFVLIERQQTDPLEVNKPDVAKPKSPQVGIKDRSVTSDPYPVIDRIPTYSRFHRDITSKHQQRYCNSLFHEANLG